MYKKKLKFKNKTRAGSLVNHFKHLILLIHQRVQHGIHVRHHGSSVADWRSLRGMSVAAVPVPVVKLWIIRRAAHFIAVRRALRHEPLLRLHRRHGTLQAHPSLPGISSVILLIRRRHFLITLLLVLRQMRLLIRVEAVRKRGSPLVIVYRLWWVTGESGRRWRDVRHSAVDVVEIEALGVLLDGRWQGHIVVVVLLLPVVIVVPAVCLAVLLEVTHHVFGNGERVGLVIFHFRRAAVVFLDVLVEVEEAVVGEEGWGRRGG